MKAFKLFSIEQNPSKEKLDIVKSKLIRFQKMTIDLDNIEIDTDEEYKDVKNLTDTEMFKLRVCLCSFNVQTDYQGDIQCRM